METYPETENDKNKIKFNVVVGLICFTAKRTEDLGTIIFNKFSSVQFNFNNTRTTYNHNNTQGT